MRLFHGLSRKMHMWLTKQPHVKEESLTDWLLFELSENCDFIKYYAFTRNEESLIGADWDWWVLTNTNAYRFRVQAKKLRPNKNNWASFSYGNKNDIQIDLLLESAKQDSAFPLYMLYSTALSDVKKQLENYKKPLLQEMIKWCGGCPCASFISPAETIYDMIFGEGKKEIYDEPLLNASIKLCSFDYFHDSVSINEAMKRINECLELLNALHSMKKSSNSIKGHEPTGFKYDYRTQWGNSRNKKEIPNWLDSIIREQNAFSHSEIPMWLEGEFKRELSNTLGFGIVDLRDSKNL